MRKLVTGSRSALDWFDREHSGVRFLYGMEHHTLRARGLVQLSHFSFNQWYRYQLQNLETIAKFQNSIILLKYAKHEYVRARVGQQEHREIHDINPTTMVLPSI